MTREDFINKLNRGLRDYPDKNDIVAYYYELISDKMDNGLSEAEAVKSLGTVDTIINDILTNQGDNVTINDEEKASRFVEKSENVNYKDGSETKSDKKSNTSSKHLGFVSGLIYFLFSFSIVILCIVAIAIIVAAVIVNLAGGAMIAFGGYEFQEGIGVGFTMIGIGIFTLGFGFLFLYFSNLLRRYIFKNKKEWRKKFRSSLVGE
jgi:uncharacterized membrane protein